MTSYQSLVYKVKALADFVSQELVLPRNTLDLLKNADSHSLWIKEPTTQKNTQMILSIKPRGKKDNKYGRILLKANALNNRIIHESITVIPDKNDTSICYIDANPLTDEIYTLIQEIISDTVRGFEPAEKFGCCSMFRECSEAKNCLHKNLFYAKACWYRKNLENGKIFY